MSITVYTNPSCVQCEQTKKYLTSKELAYEVVDLSKNPEAMDMVMEMGYKAAPVVIAGENHWSGFRPDIITRLAESKLAA
jgi:glutaredoxin-like protein NrdH